MNKVNAIKTTLAILWLAFAWRPAAQAAVLTLPDAAQTVLQANAALDAADAQAEGAASGVSYARASYLPGLSLSGAYTHGNNPVYAFGTLLGQSRFEMGDFMLDKLNHPSAVSNLQGQAGLQMQLVNLQRKKQLEAAKAGGKAANEGRQIVRQQILGQTIEVYYGLMLAQKQSDILRERIQESEEELKDATRLKEQGLVLGSDYHLARAILGQLKQQLVQAESQVLAARAAMNILMSRPEEADFETSGSLEISTPPVVDLQAFKADLAGHPLLKSAQYGADGAKADAKAEARGSWPVFSGFSVVEGNGYKMDQGGWNYLAGVKLGMPLFDPGHGPRVRMKRDAARGLEAARKTVEDRLRADLHQKVRAYQSAQKRLDLALQTETEARSALAMFKKLYRSGRQSIADVMQGEAALTQSQAGLQQVYYDLRTGYARALQAAGKLDSVPEIYAR